MIILFFLLIIILFAIFYFELRVTMIKIPKDIFENYEFSRNRYMERNIFTISPKTERMVNYKEANNIKKELKTNKAILYIHGGSYVGGLEKYHWKFFEDLVDETNSTIIAPDYPLTPENTYMEVFKIMEPLYKEIIEKVEDKEFILMGDSAGAGLTLALYQMIGEQKYRLPDKTILISPWLDVRLSNPEIDKIDDPILKRKLLQLSGMKYSGKNGKESYMVNPVLGPTDKLKNIYILSGTRDILNPDAKKFANENKDKVKFIEYEGAVHNFILVNYKEDGTLHAKEGYDKIIEIIFEKE